MKCATCGKTIQNTYYLDGKAYGYNCYKIALVQKYIALEQIKNDKYIAKCVSAIEIFSNKTFKDTWNQDFQKSILSQWTDCQKLTAKQLECIIKKFTETEQLQQSLLYCELIEDTDEEKSIYSKIDSNNKLFEQFKNNEMLHKIIKNKHTRKRTGEYKKQYVVYYKDIDEEEKLYRLLELVDLEQYKNDEYIEVLEIIEVV